MIGITGFGAYVPRLRLPRQVAAQANAWYAPQFGGRKGARAFANWDEDSVTMAVAAARDCLGPAEDRSHVRAVLLATDTPPFAERLNAAIVAGALTLDDDIEAADLGGTPRVALTALTQAVARATAFPGEVLVLAADRRKARPGSAQELEYGDGAAAALVGRDKVLAQFLGSATLSVDFVDHFRASGESIDYQWEERWIRDEGVSKLVPRVVAGALRQAGIAAEQVDHLLFPTSFARMDAQVAKACGIHDEAVAASLIDRIGDCGAAHGLIMLADGLERAKPGQIIVLAAFGSGAQAIVLRATPLVESFRPTRGVRAWIARGKEEPNYTRFLSFGGQLSLERGMRGEQDRKTALSTAWRHRNALLGLVAGKCRVTGSVHFPPSRLSYDPQGPLQDTQEPYKLADRPARVLSWSAEYLSYHPSPPHHYGQIDFEGGGRILMDFTDLDVGEVDSGTPMEMVFRIKDIDTARNYTRYFWKATPARGA
ncbi:MAG TPA: 3-oxoacyl-[acyl-carrier-protein] synthase III C-terminal domain-containing protein [Roseiarcus sp.]|nr:3-oxoacyl-[acyl-carrier-protein] synthase III C-terminal domain-containing protein [Roseiarcus sp.]